MGAGTRGGLPEKIGHYKIVSELGRGGMGVVYKAFEESLNRFVAIKVLGDHLATDEQFLSRFTREARAAGGLSHPNVIPIYFIGEDDGLHYFAMEFVSGRSVQSMIRSEGRIGNPRALQIVVQAAHGLAAAHDAGIIHRDIKPANLMVDDRGVVKIADFGVALPAEAQTKLTATGALMGTPGYLSPEQCMGESIDHRTDIYALGVTYYEMLTGRMPFNAESPLALLRQILQDDPPDVSQLNAEVDDDAKRILMKMIARNRDERYQSCHDVIADVEEYLASRKIRNFTSSLATRSTAAPGASATPTVIVGPAVVTAAAATAAAATAPGVPLKEPATQPQAYVPPPPAPPKKKSSFALIAAIAILVFVAGVAGAGLIGYKYVRGFFAGDTKQASVLSVPTSSATPVVDPKDGVQLSNPVPTALDTAKPVSAPTIVPAQGTHLIQQIPIQKAGTEGNHPAPAVRAPTPVLSGAPASSPAGTPAPHREEVAIAVQGESGLNGAVADVLSAELSSAGLKVVNADDIPATEGMAGNASAGALLGRLRGHAGTLVIARIEPTGQRELHYMGRSDTAYTSRVSVTVYDVASGQPIGARNSGSIEYTSINANKKAEEVVGPLAQKAAESIQNH